MWLLVLLLMMSDEGQSTPIGLESLKLQSPSI